MLHYCYFYLIITINTVFGATLLNCPKSKLKFEKILGVEPLFVDEPKLLYKNKNNLPITTECISRCQSNDDCYNFVIFYKNSTCYWYQDEGNSFNTTSNPDTAWFSKLCLEDKNCTNLWYFERIPGATLIDNDTKTLPEAVTRQQCQQQCLNQDEFICRSAKFKIKSEHFSTDNETLGFCILSSSDRHLSNSYRVSNFYDEYFENQCSYRDDKKNFCSYDEFDKVLLSHSDVFYERKTKNQCQQLCDSQKLFNCRGFSIDDQARCFLHSEDSKVQGPKLLTSHPNGQYFEKSKCINISAVCSDKKVQIAYLPSEAFYGRIYLNGYYENEGCSRQGSGFQEVLLDIPIDPNQCGIVKTLGPYNRTLWSGLLVVQNNPLIQTQSDRLIKIGCLYKNDSKVLVGTGLQISSMIPYTGYSEINSTFFSISPTIQMRVIDLQTQKEVNDVEIGQDLQLFIEIQPYNGTFDIWVGHLVAMTEKNDESILLIDDRGCPINKNIFPTFTKHKEGDTLVLSSTFKAFKFVSSPVVRFSAIVQFCTDQCPMRDCNGRVLNRLQRSTNNNETEISEIQQDNNNTKIHLMPVELIILVRDSKQLTDRLVLENNKLLLAGYDYSQNEVCMDYSLFIGLIVVWVLLQVFLVVSGIILVKRYRNRFENELKKRHFEAYNSNFGLGYSNLQPKSRVRWADYD